MSSLFSFRHLINTHHEKIDARLCEHCGHRSKNRHDLYHHIQVQHKIMPPQGITFPICKHCDYVALDKPALALHEEQEGHQAQHSPGTSTRSKAGAAAAVAAATVNKQEAVKEENPDEFRCELCDKSFISRKALSMHCVAKHKRRSRKQYEDEDEDEEESDEEEVDEADEDEVDFDSALKEDVEYVPKAELVGEVVKGKVKGKTRSSEAESLTTVATGIATSLGLGEGDHSAELEFAEGEDIVDEAQYIEEALASVHGEAVKGGTAAAGGTAVETKFLAEDGSELQLTAAQKAELMSQLETSDVVEQEEEVEEGASAEGEELLYGDESMEEGEVLKDGDDVLMVYGGPRTAKTNTVVEKEDKSEGKGDQSLAEEDGDEIAEEKVEKEKNKLIKELEGDWTDDQEEEFEVAAPVVVDKKSVVEVVAAAAKKEVVKEEVLTDVSITEEKLAEEVKEEGDNHGEAPMDVDTELVSTAEKDEVNEVTEKQEVKVPEVDAEVDVGEKVIKAKSSEKKEAPSSNTLAEFMSDWPDEEN